MGHLRGFLVVVFCYLIGRMKNIQRCLMCSPNFFASCSFDVQVCGMHECQGEKHDSILHEEATHGDDGDHHCC